MIRSLLGMVLRPGLLSLVFCSCCYHTATAGYLDDIGYTQLQAELAAAIPTGQGIPVAQIENEERGLTNYLPAMDHSEFAGKQFIIESGPSDPSVHATRVGQRFYGLESGVAPGITTIRNWEVDDWLNDSLRVGSSLPPLAQPIQVQNHSWKGTTGTVDSNIDALRRFDFSIDRRNVVAAVAIGNEGNDSVPILLAHNYNAITVGTSAGISNRGFTRLDGPGRIKPDLVAPEKTTSLATPLVAGAAAMLLDEVNRNSSLAAARRPEVIKAILMAGATKDQFPDWDRTTTRPLDEVFGAGQLNIRNSYYILTAGRLLAGSTPGPRGWVYGQTPVNIARDLHFDFEMPEGAFATDLSIVLTWNRLITDGMDGPEFGDLQSSLANLDLALSAIVGSTIVEIDSSVSTVDNVEHVFRATLLPGRYRLSLSSDTPNTSFALAWNSNFAVGSLGLTAVPEPSTLLLALSAGLTLLLVQGRSSFSLRKTIARGR